MNCILIARTGNEQDIIEPFIRHHSEHFTSILIYDDNSTDRTSSIIKSLIAEGAPARLIHAREVNWPWLEVSTRLMHLAFNEHGADWIAPLDVDEFIELPGDARLRTWLPASMTMPLQLRWSNFVWSRAASEAAEPNPVRRMTQRMPPREDSIKCIVPKSVVDGDPSAKLPDGNHGLYRRGEHVTQFGYSPNLALCHYPIRSINQFIGKCTRWVLGYKSLPHWYKVLAFQYDVPFKLIKSNRVEDLSAYMERESRVYALAKGLVLQGEAAHRPLNYLGGALKYSHGVGSPLADVIAIAERFADRISELERQQLADRRIEQVD